MSKYNTETGRNRSRDETNKIKSHDHMRGHSLVLYILVHFPLIIVMALLLTLCRWCHVKLALNGNLLSTTSSADYEIRDYLLRKGVRKERGGQRKIVFVYLLNVI